MPRPVTWRAQLWAAFDAFMNAASPSPFINVEILRLVQPFINISRTDRIQFIIDNAGDVFADLRRCRGHARRCCAVGAAGLLIHAVVAAEIEGLTFSPVLQWFGKISYSLYIVHYLVMKWIANFTGLWLLSTAGTIIASILLSIGLAVVLHIIIEAPLIGWGRKWSMMRRDQQTSDVPRREGTVRIPARAE